MPAQGAVRARSGSECLWGEQCVSRHRTFGSSVSWVLMFVLLAGPVLGADSPQGASTPNYADSLSQSKPSVIVPGPALSPDARMGKRHMKPAPGVVCVECHDIDYGVDATTSATQLYINNGQQLAQEQIWGAIETFLPGRERFMLATSADDRPVATTLDMVLDREERVFYVVSEVGTEKLLQLRRNPAVSAVHFDFGSWSVAEGGAKVWSSVQVNGTAEVIPPSDPRFLPMLKKYNPVRLTMERALRRIDVVRVTPQRIVYFNTALAASGYAVYQLWERDRTNEHAD